MANASLPRGGLKMAAMVTQQDSCDVCARPLTDGVVMVGRIRCCSIACALVAKPIEPALTVLHGGLPVRRRSFETDRAASYHIRWR